MILAKGVAASAAIPLASVVENGTYVVDRVAGPEQRRLCEMGLVEGAKVSVVNRSHGDMMVVRVGGCRLALARGMADCVLVK